MSFQKKYHYADSESGSENEFVEATTVAGQVSGQECSGKAGHSAGEVWSKALEEEDLRTMLAEGTFINERRLNDRGVESYGYSVDLTSSSRGGEAVEGTSTTGGIFDEPADFDGVETFGVDPSKLRKRVHAQLDEYPRAVPIIKEKVRFKDGKRFKSPAGTFSDDDEESANKRARGGSFPTMRIQSLRPAPSSLKPNQPKVSTIGDDEAGDDWSALRTFSTLSREQSRQSRPQTIPNDKKFVHPNFLRDDYSLRNLLDTTIPPDMDIYEMGDAMATALGDKNPDSIVEAVVKLGRERAIDVFRQTQAKEESGGMNVTSNYRRRTPGGVYLYFAREILEADANMMHEETKNESSESEDG